MLGWAVYVASWLVAATLLGLGNTVGYHRLLAHKSFEPARVTHVVLTLLGALHSGSPLMWVGLHRLHHTRSDQPDDPHTPVVHGFWWAHSGWVVKSTNPVVAVLFALSGFGQQVRILVHDVLRVLGRNPPEWRTMCGDLNDDWLLVVLDVPFVMPMLFVWQLAAAWAIGGPWGLLWLWLLHLFLTNASWAVNSVGHSAAFGRQTWQNGDGSRDVPWLAFVTNGEGYHNTHHRWPRSARHGLEGGPDLSWWTIWALCRLGLARKPWLPKGKRPRE